MIAVQRGSHISCLDYFSMTPLTAAASAGNHHACEMLLLLRADVNKPCSFYDLSMCDPPLQLL